MSRWQVTSHTHIFWTVFDSSPALTLRVWQYRKNRYLCNDIWLKVISRYQRLIRFKVMRQLYVSALWKPVETCSFPILVYFINREKEPIVSFFLKKWLSTSIKTAIRLLSVNQPINNFVFQSELVLQTPVHIMWRLKCLEYCNSAWGLPSLDSISENKNTRQCPKSFPAKGGRKWTNIAAIQW